ncbi:ferritin-like domain-containing protein [Jatrophihabitans sp.]|uniref:ferritin-like domain-containing protein n=1 Tax=Jatrophihabitans sp. TaxID=1932789 RepID=UPI0030C7801D|nr:hypothetical protein [Jatrophihabitans sp.]
MTTNDKRPHEMAISEAELSSMTRELDTMHNDSFSGVKKSLEDFSANLSHLATGKATARRSFLLGAGGLAVVGGVAACSSSGGGSNSASSTSSSPTGSSSATSPYTGDLKVVALAAALENLAVAAYGMALTAAGKGTYGTVPKAIGTFVTVAMSQHKQHAAAWNGVLTKAGLKAVTTPALTITTSEVAKLTAAKTIPEVAMVALGLEQAATETYTFATANVTDAGGIMTAATIQPVEAMHAAILSFVLGQYPVPDSFIGITGAVGPAALTV